MEKFDYSDIARTNVKYDGARPWDCQHLQAILGKWGLRLRCMKPIRYYAVHQRQSGYPWCNLP